MTDIRQKVLDNPNKPAYVMGGSGEVVTRLQLDERGNQCAHLFRHLGLQTKDHIAIFMENNRQYLEICSAASRSGLIYTAISTHLKLSEIEYIVGNCGAKAFITSKAMADQAVNLVDKMPQVTARLMVGGVIDGFDSYEEKTAEFPKTPIADEAAGQDMLYSSGTTGRPKGIKVNFAELPYGEIPDAGKLLIALYGFTEESVYLSPAPLYHSAPLRFCMLNLYAGGTVVVMEKFEAQASLALIEKYKVTHSQWVPTMFVRMIKLPEEERTKYDVTSMQIAIHAAAPIPIPVKEQMIDWWGPVFFEYYAGTESNGLTQINSEEWLTHKGSVGRPLFGVLHILDEQGKDLAPGEAGLVYFGDGIEFEYHEDPNKTASSRTPEGWSTMGDIGYVDPEGFLYLTDRQANMIISGGVNIYPQEAENVLIMHPEISDVAVFGVPNPEFGEEVKGVVQLKDTSLASPEMERELLAFCQSNLTKIKCPKSIDFDDNLPRTPTGKLIKRLVKERYWKGEKRI
ncbi:MAG: acyl-CoA synthetase [Proteobacteria bacterium]|nr:acyl-CoA synthetase [Pseudomonadota bacterium]